MRSWCVRIASKSTTRPRTSPAGDGALAHSASDDVRGGRDGRGNRGSRPPARPGRDRRRPAVLRRGDVAAHPRRAGRRDRRARAALLVVALVWQWLDVHLTFFGTLPEPTPGDGVRYVVTASACVVLATAGLLAALAAGHPRVAALGVVVLVVALVAASLLAVPSDRWAREPVDRPAPAYEPCFSGSGDCVGG